MTKATTRAAKRPTLSDAERHERFKHMADEVGADDAPEAFDQAFARVVTSPHPKAEKPE